MSNVSISELSLSGPEILGLEARALELAAGSQELALALLIGATARITIAAQVHPESIVVGYAGALRVLDADCPGCPNCQPEAPAEAKPTEASS